jgi:CheY-like chemotaxis protein
VKLHGGKIGVLSDGEGNGSSFYIDIPISKIERGSNYKHVSPAHLDVSSRNKYNSPAVSPDQRTRKGQHSGNSSPAVKNCPTPVPTHVLGFNPNRAFISPESERASYRVTLAPTAEKEDSTHSRSSLNGLGIPLAQVPPLLTTNKEADTMENAVAQGVQNALRAPLYPHQHTTAGYTGSAAGSLPKQLSDQSIFTGGSSNRSNQSRGTNQSSFSTDTDDGVSSKTEVIDASARNLPAFVPSLQQIEAESSGEHAADEDRRETMFTPYTSANPAVNLFPEDFPPVNSQPHSSTVNSSAAASRHPSGPEAMLRPHLQPLYIPPPTHQSASHHASAREETATAPSVISSEALRAKLLFEKRALIVDDSATNRKFVNRLLRTKIGTRDEAEDGQQAVSMVERARAEGAPYDVILMDYVMPVMDGPTATAQVRRNGFQGIILGVTGNGHQAEIDLFKSAGADRILVKPLSADQFHAIMLGR